MFSRFHLIHEEDRRTHRSVGRATLKRGKNVLAVVYFLVLGVTVTDVAVCAVKLIKDEHIVIVRESKVLALVLECKFLTLYLKFSNTATQRTSSVELLGGRPRKLTSTAPGTLKRSRARFRLSSVALWTNWWNSEDSNAVSTS